MRRVMRAMVRRVMRRIMRMRLARCRRRLMGGMPVMVALACHSLTLLPERDLNGLDTIFTACTRSTARARHGPGHSHQAGETRYPAAHWP